MTNGKWGIIINPAAGNGFARIFSTTVKEKFAQQPIDAVIRFTERRGHATELADDLARQGCTVIIAVGGDGTANETARAILHRNDVTFGMVSAGTGNDFAPALGFSGHFTEADWQAFFELNTVRMDVGKCNDNYFLNGMGLGFDAQVAAENYNPEGAVKGGSGTKYLRHILKNLILYKERMFHAEFDGRTRDAMTFMKTIGNGRRIGGGYFLTPKAIINDGLLDICLVEPLALGERLKLFLKAPKGRHLDHPKVTYFHTDKIRVEFDKSVPHHLDGELFFCPNIRHFGFAEKAQHHFQRQGRALFRSARAECINSVVA